MLKADDADSVLQEVSAWKDIDRLLQPLNGEKVTLAWVAANLGAERIMRLLVARGADVEFVANGMQIRALGLLKPQILRGIAAGGVRLTSVELACLFGSALPSDLPTDENYNLLHEAAQVALDVGIANLAVFKERVRNGSLFQEKCKFQSDLPRTSFEIEELVDGAASALAYIVCRALSILCKYDGEIATLVKRHFRGFRRNRSWLQSSARRATEEITRQVAAAEECYEEDITDAVNFLICRYPVAAVTAAASEVRVVDHLKTGATFEGRCFEILVASGYEVRRVGGSGDQGADLIANAHGLSYAVQCKDYGEGVGNAAVQQVVAARSYYQTDFAVVCAPNGFTKSARSLAAVTDTLLVPPELLHDLDRLRRLIG